MSQPPVPRWLEEVRAQRRALQQQRRAAHQARREALDPIGAAQREQRKDQLLRRRQELRNLIDQGRQYYLNQGPWLAPLAPKSEDDAPETDSIAEQKRTSPVESPRAEEQPAAMTPSEWNNLWYYKGW
jgi:hypothetical protein